MNHRHIISAIKVVFYAMFLHSAYRKLKSSLSITKIETKKSFKLVPEKGIFGTASWISKGCKD